MNKEPRIDLFDESDYYEEEEKDFDEDEHQDEEIDHALD
jgi:hypothetical protein